MQQLSPFIRKPVPFKLDNGNTVYLRRLSAADYVQWTEWAASKAYDDSAQLIALSLCSEDGNRVLRDGEFELAKQIDLVTLKALGHEIMTLNNLNKPTPSPAVATHVTPAVDDTEKKPTPVSDSTNSSAA